MEIEEIMRISSQHRRALKLTGIAGYLLGLGILTGMVSEWFGVLLTLSVFYLVVLGIIKLYDDDWS